MEETSLSLKAYIEEFSELQKSQPFNERAFKEYIKSNELSPTELETLEKLATGHGKRSQELLMQGKKDHSIISLERAIELKPLSTEYRNRLAQLYIMQKRERDALDQAQFSLSLERNNPIAKSIIKDIKRNTDKEKGRDQYKKLIIPGIFLLLIIGAALFTQTDFNFNFLNQNENEKEDAEAIVNKTLQKEEFDSLSFPVELQSMNKNFALDLVQSQMEKTNGSISYTLQGTLINDSEPISSAEIVIRFRNYERDVLFEKSLDLIEENDIVYPGEPILIDEFFYMHYLPPDIDNIDILIRDIKAPDELPDRPEPQPLKLEWEANRPEGVRLSVSLIKEDIIHSYSQNYGKYKIQMINEGNIPIDDCVLELTWRDDFGSILHSKTFEAIKKSSPPLSLGDKRYFSVFTDLPDSTFHENVDFYINISRIN